MTKKHPMACQPLPVMGGGSLPNSRLIEAAAKDLYEVVERLCEGDFGIAEMVAARRALAKARGEA